MYLVESITYTLKGFVGKHVFREVSLFTSAVLQFHSLLQTVLQCHSHVASMIYDSELITTQWLVVISIYY